jgi:hypothetical protein
MLIKLLNIFFLWIYCLGYKGQVIGRFRLADYSNISTSYTLYSVLVLYIYSLIGLSAGISEVYRLYYNKF